jgi:hypothetical protein
VARDPDWLDRPADRLEARFKALTDSAEPQPLIESTMERLDLLERMHKDAQPEMPLAEAARDLKRQIQALRK